MVYIQNARITCWKAKMSNKIIYEIYHDISATHIYIVIVYIYEST